MSYDDGVVKNVLEELHLHVLACLMNARNGRTKKESILGREK